MPRNLPAYMVLSPSLGQVVHILSDSEIPLPHPYLAGSGLTTFPRLYELFLLLSDSEDIVRTVSLFMVLGKALQKQKC